MQRFGLRSRVIAAFGLGALLLSTILSMITYSLTRSNLVDNARTEVFAGSLTRAVALQSDLVFEHDVVTRRLQSELLSASSSTISDPTGFDPLAELPLQRMVDQLATPADHVAILEVNTAPYFGSEDFAVTDLDPNLWNEVLADRSVEMMYDAPDGVPAYVVSFHLAGLQERNISNVNATYLEVASFENIEETLRALLLTLIGASMMTTVFGFGFGIYVARLVFAPLRYISRAATRVADGDLTTRLTEVPDADLHDLIRSFNDMTSALQHRIERDARFASDVSHELRSPLMTLTGSVAVLERRRDELPERSQVALDLIGTDIRRFKQLVEDLLEISRFDVGAVALETEEVLMVDFVRHIAQASARDYEVQVRTDAVDDELIALIDKRRIAQVLRNLAENADKYAGGLEGIGIRATDTDVMIDVEDLGPGIPAGERDEIFERFARGSEGGRRGDATGVGLGLSLVREHIRLHGGTIEAADRLDGRRGARFVITLPGVVVDE